MKPNETIFMLSESTLLNDFNSESMNGETCAKHVQIRKIPNESIFMLSKLTKSNDLNSESMKILTKRYMNRTGQKMNIQIKGYMNLTGHSNHELNETLLMLLKLNVPKSTDLDCIKD